MSLGMQQPIWDLMLLEVLQHYLLTSPLVSSVALWRLRGRGLGDSPTRKHGRTPWVFSVCLVLPLSRIRLSPRLAKTLDWKWKVWLRLVFCLRARCGVELFTGEASSVNLRLHRIGFSLRSFVCDGRHKASIGEIGRRRGDRKEIKRFVSLQYSVVPILFGQVYGISVRRCPLPPCLGSVDHGKGSYLMHKIFGPSSRTGRLGRMAGK